MAAGSRQSPVNIETDRVESDHEALISKPLRWKYPATASRKLVNPGYCWRIDTDGEGTCEYIHNALYSYVNSSILSRKWRTRVLYVTYACLWVYRDDAESSHIPGIDIM